jgi:quinol-cytochrome oxidoreductase complex cytochrome b subunit
LGILSFGLAFALWLFVPFWDRKTAQGHRNRFLNYLGIFVIAFILLMTIYGWLS